MSKKKKKKITKTYVGILTYHLYVLCAIKAFLKEESHLKSHRM